MSELNVKGMIPVLALRGLVVFPEQTIHFDIGRVKSGLALESAMKNDQILMLVPQKSVVDDDPNINDLYPIGTVVKVKQILKANRDNVRVLVQGLYRAKISELVQFAPYLAADIERVDDIAVSDSIKCRALRRDATAMFGIYVDMSENAVKGIQLQVMASDNTGYIADTIAHH